MPSCIGHLHTEGFEQWLHDIGLGHTIEQLKGLDGAQLKSYMVNNLEEVGLSFADSSELLLRAYMTHHRVSAAPHFAPPAGLLSWDAKATSTWLKGLGAPYASLASLGYTGACLCSLNHPRVRTILDIASFDQLRRKVRDHLVLDNAPQWAHTWSGLAVIEL